MQEPREGRHEGRERQGDQREEAGPPPPHLLLRRRPPRLLQLKGKVARLSRTAVQGKCAHLDTASAL